MTAGDVTLAARKDARVARVQRLRTSTARARVQAPAAAGAAGLAPRFGSPRFRERENTRTQGLPAPRASAFRLWVYRQRSLLPALTACHTERFH